MEGSSIALARRPPTPPQCSISPSTLAFDQRFTSTANGILLLAEMVCGMLVWILLAGTEYFHLSALCWVMFVSISCWVITICLFIIYLTGAQNRTPRVPWTTLSLCLNSSATALYLLTAVLEVLSLQSTVTGRHTHNCWTASICFAILTTVCYGGSSHLSYQAWKANKEAC
ncbi:CKLF-like MARVEL transmembrane domain-containing protein 8b [Syngnathoides biaculeatus]|uniref:CKLF-like MARVEL transmembrane domain-containing protein 8b n=1 Tax=Syngnathoides biaculeatus TaxID=300417 RepID=UPI002ADD9082|nr:CKLF-like MARVEL transmembrane domain-containing protein 8b [Syngnathoides biaculeatus]XP_061675882.1 CKLF-like MARVEL transmembrane domain-containing protein 8b [Syngnathoides biaculeatus]